MTQSSKDSLFLSFQFEYKRKFNNPGYGYYSYKKTHNFSIYLIKHSEFKKSFKHLFSVRLQFFLKNQTTL